MFLDTFRKTQQRLERSRQIAQILIKYGFDFVVDQLGLSGPGWPALSVGRPAELRGLSIYVRLRRMLEELGPTFVKLGQMLSTRADLLPQELLHELEKLQDEVPPFSFDLARAVIESELGDSLESLFTEFSSTPFAAASVGQVHKATLPDGTNVVVKVQRPGIERQAEADLLIMQDLAHLAVQRTEWGKIYAVDELIEEFSYQLRDQLDYTVEGRHTDAFRRFMTDIPRMYVPRVFWEYSTRRVLTTELVEGIKFDQHDLLEAAGIDTKDVAAAFVEIMATQALSKGIYHADPHPGNVMLGPDNTIVFVDFGMVGYLDDELKEQMLDFVLAVVQGDVDAVVYSLLKIGIVKQTFDRPRIKADIRRLLRKYYEVPLAEVSPVEAIEELLFLATKHRVRLPADLTLLIKAALIVEGVATQLDPEMSIVDIAKPFAVRIQQERLAPDYFIKQISRQARLLHRLMSGLPVRLDNLLRLFEVGELTVRVEVAYLSQYVRQLSTIANRLSFAIVIAATLVASAVSLQSKVGPSVFDIPVIAILGFVLSIMLSLWLLIAILRSGAL